MQKGGKVKSVKCGGGKVVNYKRGQKFIQSSGNKVVKCEKVKSVKCGRGIVVNCKRGQKETRSSGDRMQKGTKRSKG